jgi:hypothetical protein
MEDKQLNVLEDRINKAIDFIETLKAKEKTLVDEKENIGRKVEELHDQIVEKDQKIEELLESQVFLKNKIETVLNKLESLANFDMGTSGEDEELPAEETSSFNNDPKPGLEEETEKPLDEHDTEGQSASEIYVEENIVDLKDEDGTEQKPDSNSTLDTDRPDAGMVTPQVDQSPLFDIAENEHATEEEEASEEQGFMKKTEQEQKPFSDNPFIEM